MTIAIRVETVFDEVWGKDVYPPENEVMARLKNFCGGKLIQTRVVVPRVIPPRDERLGIER